MEKLIRIVGNLQSVYRKIGVEKNFDLPQIVVVGAQSSGKSSTLEALVGKEFLPRGENICTRRPLQLELVHIDENEELCAEGREWAVFPGDPPDYPKTFTNFQDVCAEIEHQTETKASGKTVSDDPINLTVFSPDVCTLTVIDLPGLTEVSVKGQPEDIPSQIKEMVTKYISSPRCIILAVHPANVDSANCVALRVAKEHDLSGGRTIAVITKLDRIQGSPESIIPLLTGKQYDKPLLGIIGIYNRTPMDGPGFTNKQAKAREAQFLRSNFPPEVARVMGVDYLASTLSKILLEHILECLPDIKSDVGNEIVKQKEIIENLGDSTGYQQQEAGGKLTAILDAYTKKIFNYVDGVHDHPMDDMLIGGARIKEIFTDDFAQEVEYVDPISMMRKHVKRVLENASGVSANIFSPDSAFQMLVRQYIANLMEPSLNIVVETHSEMGIIADVAWKSLKLNDRFPKLANQVTGGTSVFLRDALERTKKQVEILFNKEMAYINTNHRNILLYMKKHEGSGSDNRNKSHLRLYDPGEKQQWEANSTEHMVNGHYAESNSSGDTLNYNSISGSTTSLNVKDSEKIKGENKKLKDSHKKEKGAFRSIVSRKKKDRKRPIDNDQAIMVQPRQDVGADASLKNKNIEQRMLSDPEFLIEMVKTYYYEVVLTNILDLVPKTVMLDLVYLVTGPKYPSPYKIASSAGRQGTDVHLFEYLNTLLQVKAATLLAESDIVATKRKSAEDAIKVLGEMKISAHDARRNDGVL